MEGLEGVKSQFDRFIPRPVPLPPYLSTLCSYAKPR
jgi:hypothetical protein